MKIQYCPDFKQMSALCANTVIASLKERPDQLLCAATGSSPKALYENLAKAYNSTSRLFDQLKIVKLDEWGGIAADDPNSCEMYIRENLLQPLKLGSDRFLSFNSDTDRPEQECKRVQAELQAWGPIDLCILGLGQNGHIGFNEPAEYLQPHCHVTQLSKASLQHQMIGTMDPKPEFGMTLGMADILQSGKIILLLTGTGKKEVISQFLSGQISTQLPASFLWLHGNVTCFVDSRAL